MCLDVIREKGKEVKKLEGTGWKIFVMKSDKKLTSVYKGNHKPFRIGRWLREQDFRNRDYTMISLSHSLMSGQTQYYRTGFHIYLSQQLIPRKELTSTNKRIKKVKYRAATCIGSQDGCDVVVARQMLIIPKKRRSE